MPPATTPINRRPNRTRQVANHIKELVVREGLHPGDKLPSEAALMAALDKSKGTVREAMRMLEAEGLIRTRTGPGGGAFLTEMSADHAATLLANYFYFKDLSIRDLYQVRILLEPEVAASVAGQIPETVMASFRSDAARFELPPTTAEEERIQHVASLYFHRKLAALCPNPLLAFMVDFVAKILSDLTVIRHLYEPQNLELWSSGREFHQRLLDTLEKGPAETARSTMRAYMENAYRLMQDQEVAIAKERLR